MQQPTFNTCTVNNFDGQYFPKTLSAERYKIQPYTKYFYTWFSIDEDCENNYSDGDRMVMCIYINNGWHQVQSIDFDFDVK